MSENMMLPQPPELMPERYMPQPKVMKVLGIIDFVILGYSVLMMLFCCLLIAFLGYHIYDIYHDTHSSLFDNETTKALTNISLVCVVNGIVFILLSIMMFQAGRELMKGTDKGRILSNRYAWTSIVAKIFLLTVGLYLYADLSKIEGLNVAGGAMNITPPKVSSIGEILETLRSYLVSIIYPVLCLILLNRKSLKDYLRERENSPIVSE